VAAVERLVTFVDLDPANDPGPDARSMHVSARLDAEVDDGRRVVLLDDRGWGGMIKTSWDHEPSEEERRQAESLRAWEHETVEQLEREARSAVGPDEPLPSETQAEMEAAHWNMLASTLARQGVEITADELSRLPHDVELSDRVLARIGPS
jgi:hypothetical protein